MATLICQLSGRKILQDVVENLEDQVLRFDHLGMKEVSRSTLARVNDEQPRELHEESFYKMLQSCRDMAPKHRLILEDKVHLLNATFTKICLAAFLRVSMLKLLKARRPSTPRASPIMNRWQELTTRGIFQKG